MCRAPAAALHLPPVSLAHSSARPRPLALQPTSTSFSSGTPASTRSPHSVHIFRGSVQLGWGVSRVALWTKSTLWAGSGPWALSLISFYMILCSWESCRKDSDSIAFLMVLIVSIRAYKSSKLVSFQDCNMKQLPSIYSTECWPRTGFPLFLLQTFGIQLLLRGSQKDTHNGQEWDNWKKKEKFHLRVFPKIKCQ